MDEEIDAGAVWRKAIPQARDRLQSRLLVGLVGSLLVAMGVWTMMLAVPNIGRFPAFILGGAGVSLTFAAAVWLLKAATPAGAGFGGVVCLLLIYWTGSFVESIGRTALTPLAALFVLTFISTRAGRQRKKRAGLAEGRRGRSASQVIANLSVAALCVTPLAYTAIGRSMPYCCVSGIANVWIGWTMTVMCLAALVEAAADTVSSEIGQAFGGAPRMLLSWRRVAAGTDGAVTALGTLAGVAAGVAVASIGAWAMRLHLREASVAVVAGVCGLFFDSLLGATVERKGWLGNDLVNFTSTAFAAGVAAVMYMWNIF